MAEQSSLPVTPKSIVENESNLRRSSFGKASSSNSGERIPHYLRASTGSCHDFCKYGHRQAFEEKARQPFLRRTTKKTHDEQNSVEAQLERKKTSVDKLKRSPNSASNSPEIIKREVAKRLVNSRPSVHGDVLAEEKKLAGELLTKSVESRSPVLRHVLTKKKTSAQQELTASVDSQTLLSIPVQPKKNLPSHGRNKISVNSPRTSTGSKTRSSPKLHKQDILSLHEKLEVPSKQASSKAKEANLSAKGARYLKQQLSSPNASRISSGRRNNDTEIGQRTATLKIAVKQVQASPRASAFSKISVRGIAKGLASPTGSLSPKPSLLRVASLNSKMHMGLIVLSPLKNQSKIEKADSEPPKIQNDDPVQPTNEFQEANDIVQEKTLYVIKMKTENKYLEADQNENLSAELSPPPLSSSKSPPLSESPTSSTSHIEEDEEEYEYTVTEGEDDPSEYDETEDTEETETLKGECKGTHQKARMISSEDTGGQPVQLRFRRGKVVDIQSENNGPRRLKFRRGRVLGDSQTFKADGRRSFKRRVKNGNTNDGEPDSEKVVLRHQDVHEKKDAKGLFNNVIEETASKLVETRKSKVKALVGAFETVISLQDSKPSASLD